MARMRTLKPEAAASETMSEIPRAMRWTFSMLWTYCDDQGRAVWNAKLVKAAIYPLDDDMTADVIEAELQELRRVGAICRYEIGTKTYLHVPSWHDHQHPNRPVPSKLPPCPKDDHSPNAHAQRSAPAVSESGALTPVVVDGDVEGDGEGDSSSDAPRPDVDRLCQHLADRIEANGVKRPTITKRWRDAARLMLDADDVTERDAHGAIDWCQSHEFWRSNVLSMPTLRAKYPTLRLQAERGRASPGVSRQQQETDDLFDRAARRMGVVAQ